MKKKIMTRTRVGFLIGIACGATVWLASPLIVGTMEPWDADASYYPLALLVAGILAALVDPERFWVSAFGIYIGQFLYAFLFLPGGLLWIIGMMSGAMFLLCSLFGGLIVHVSWRLLKRLRKGNIEPHAPLPSEDTPSEGRER